MVTAHFLLYVVPSHILVDEYFRIRYVPSPIFILCIYVGFDHFFAGINLVHISNSKWPLHKNLAKYIEEIDDSWEKLFYIILPIKRNKLVVKVFSFENRNDTIKKILQYIIFIWNNINSICSWSHFRPYHSNS